MPDFIAILGSNSLRKTIDIAAEVAGDNKNNFDEIMDITINKEYPLNMRAIRVIEICSNQYPELFLPYLESSIKQFPSFKIDGVKRVFPKIFSQFIEKISDNGKTILINTCFDYILNKNEASAIRTNCMQLMFDMSKEIPEIKEELKSVLEYIYDESSAAIQARSRMILKKMK